MKRFYLGFGLAALAAVVLATVFWLRRKPEEPITLRIVHTRAASEAAALRDLLDDYGRTHKNRRFEVYYRQEGEALPDYDVIVTNPAHLVSLQKSGEVVETGIEAAAFYEEGYQALFYNKSQGVSVPKTWDELVGQTLPTASQAFNRFGLAVPSETFAAFPFLSRALVDDDGRPRATVHAAYLKEGIETLKTLRYTFSLTPRECSAECAAQIFIEGKAPFALAGEWRWPEFAQKLGADLGIAPLPGQDFSMRSTVVFGLSRSMDPSRQVIAKALTDSWQSTAGAEQIFARLHKVPSFYLQDMKSPVDVTAAALVEVIKHSTRRMQEADYQRLLSEMRSPIQDYYQGRLASTEALDLLAKVAL